MSVGWTNPESMRVLTSPDNGEVFNERCSLRLANALVVADTAGFRRVNGIPLGLLGKGVFAATCKGTRIKLSRRPISDPLPLTTTECHIETLKSHHGESILLLSQLPEDGVTG